MPDANAIRVYRAAVDEAQVNLIGAVTDARRALDDGQFETAAHYAASAAFWDGRVKALRGVDYLAGE